MSPLNSLSFSPSLSLCFLLCCLWLTVCTVEVRWRAFRPIQLSQAWGLNNTQSPVTLHRLQLSCRWLVQLSVILQYKYKTHLFSPLSLPLFTSIVGSRLCLFFFFSSLHTCTNTVLFSPYPMSWGEVCYFSPYTIKLTFFLSGDKTLVRKNPIYIPIGHLSSKQPLKHT